MKPTRWTAQEILAVKESRTSSAATLSRLAGTLALSLGLALLPFGAAAAAADEDASDSQLRAEQRTQADTTARSDELGVKATRTPREGLFVLSVDPESPAAQAGLRIGDFVLSINGKDVESPHALRDTVERKEGKSFQLEIWRDGREKLLDISIGARGDEADRREEQSRLEGRRDRDRRDARDRDRDRQNEEAQRDRKRERDRRRESRPERDQQRRRAGREREPSRELRFAQDNLKQKPWLGVLLRPTDRPGAEIARIFPGSPAARADLREGDTLVRIADERISTAQKAGESLDRLEPGQQVELTVVRNGERKTVSAELGNLAEFHERRIAQQGDRQEQRMPDDGRRGVRRGVPPEIVLIIQHHRRLAEQHERLGRLVLELAHEVRRLREQIDRSETGSRSKSPGGRRETRSFEENVE